MRNKILVICPHPENVAPGQRLKYEQYFEYFRENNIEVVVSPFMTLRFWNIVYKRGYYLEKIFWTLFGYFRRVIDLFRLPFYKGVYIFLWVTPFGPPFFEKLYTRINNRIVYDIDDLVFLGNTSKVNKLIAPLKGVGKMRYLMKKAMHVIVCTPTLYEIALKYNSKVTDISSTINTEKYLPVNNYRNDHTIVLGWSGSHSTSKYLLLLENVLRSIKAKYNVKIKVVGDANFAFKSIEAHVSSWNEETEVKELQEIDIGLYPLPDEDWVLGKSGLKALQYMALGIPTVATAIGANFRVIEDDVDGFLVKTEQEWVERLVQLIEKPSLRERIGKNARKKVVEKFSIKANQDIYLGIVEGVLK